MNAMHAVMAKLLFLAGLIGMVVAQELEMTSWSSPFSGGWSSAEATPDPMRPRIIRRQLDNETDAVPIELFKACFNLPMGLEGALIPNVGYNMEPMYVCARRPGVTEMKIWCDVDERNTFRFWYCCVNDDCNQIVPIPPVDTTCLVGGKRYKVGYTYDITLNGRAVKMWCTSRMHYITCSGDQCGSTLDLTPPGPHRV